MTMIDTQSRTTGSEGTADQAGGESQQFQQRQSGQQDDYLRQNVGPSERQVSIAGGAILALLGVARRDTTGWILAALGGGLIYRGATGNCPLYSALNVNTAED